MFFLKIQSLTYLINIATSIIKHMKKHLHLFFFLIFGVCDHNNIFEPTAQIISFSLSDVKTDLVSKSQAFILGMGMASTIEDKYNGS
jgi:hypothetical protein